MMLDLLRGVRVLGLLVAMFAMGCGGDDEVYIPEEVPPLQELRVSGERGAQDQAKGRSRDGGFEKRREVQRIDQ